MSLWLVYPCGHLSPPVGRVVNVAVWSLDASVHVHTTTVTVRTSGIGIVHWRGRNWLAVGQGLNLDGRPATLVRCCMQRGCSLV